MKKKKILDGEQVRTEVLGSIEQKPEACPCRKDMCDASIYAPTATHSSKLAGRSNYPT